MEIAELIQKAKDPDSAPLEEGVVIPDEIVRREDRIDLLKAARDEIEKRYEKEREVKEEEYKKKLKNWEQKEKQKKRRGTKPVEPAKEPEEEKQYNFTDPESSIMKAGNGNHFEQSYNAQAAVDAEGSMLIVGNYITKAPNDKEQLAQAVGSVDTRIREIDAALADNGYFSEKAIKAVEKETGITVYASVGRKSHGKKVADLEKREEPELPAEDAGMKEIMEYRLGTKVRKEKYKLRKQTVEPVFGIMKGINTRT